MPNLCEEDVMNHVFKVVWSKTKHCYVVVSELAGMQGKRVGPRSGRCNGRQ